MFVESTDLLEDALAWKEIHPRHEIGNAALDALTRNGQLLNWNRRLIEHELDLADDLLCDFNAGCPELFATPGSNLEMSEGDYSALLEERYDWVLTHSIGLNHPIFCNPTALQRISVGPEDISDVLDTMEDAIEKGAWCILCFDLRSDVVRRFHDAFIEVVPNSLADVLWQPVGRIGSLISAFRSNLTLR